jgi:enoyl-CoA hydratase/carnithine racemase
VIAVHHDAGLCVVTLNRPDKANALTALMLAELVSAIAAARSARLFILTGAGRVFSAGADLTDVGQGLATDPGWERVSAAISALPGLSICALNGTLAGGAFGMALACDLRVAVPLARFFYPVMRLNVLPQPSDPARLVALVGPARARLILMGGVKVDAEQALAMGLIDAIADDPVAAAHDIGADALAASLPHIAAIKALI